jgi:hypothetical protein
MKQVSKIDGNGLYIEPVILQDNDGIGDLIDVPVPEGFYHPKWDGNQWVEGLSEEEIDQIKNAPKPMSEIELLKKQQADLTFTLMMAGVI